MSLLDETASDLPVKDTNCRPTVLRAIEDVITASSLPKSLKQTSPKMREKDLRTRRNVLVISREELEDSFLRLHEENLLLKGYARKQEDKIKRMATKLLRLTSDLGEKKPKDGRDLGAEETIENLQERVRDLERKNEALRQRLTTYKQRLQLQNGCRHCPYGTIAARIDSSNRKNTKLPEKYRKGLRVQGPDVDPPQVTADCYGGSLSDEVGVETDRLFQMISRNCNMNEAVAELLKHMVATKSKDLGTEIMLSLQHVQQAENQRTMIQENVMHIRLQKELREKNMNLNALKEQFQQLKESYEAELEEKQKALTLSHKAVLTQLENLSEQLKEERCKVVALEVEQQKMANLQRSLTEYHDQISDLEKEKQLLKENYENLLKSSLDLERENSWKVRGEELRVQISRLEEQLQHHEFDLTLSKEQLQHEREQSNQLKQNISKLQCQLLEKMQEIHNLQEKLSSLILSSSCAKEAPSKQEENQAQTHVQEDRILRKMYSQKDLWNTKRERKRLMFAEENSPKQDKDIDKNRGYVDLRMEVEDEGRTQLEKDTKRKMLELDAAHAETILDLEKTRELLILQQEINKDYQEELKLVKLKAECENREKEERERHYEARLLKRNSRIKVLEAQLKDIAYGTLPYRLKTEDSSSPEADVSPPPFLQRGETLFEIHFGGICFSPHGIRVVDDPQPVTFCIYSFYDFETHATPVVTGIRPQYNFTSRYAVTPDPEFLSYLRVGTLTVELYQVIGGEHCELARGRLRLDTALQSTDRLHNTIIMTDAIGEHIGDLDYWLRLHGPLSHAQCLQRQRSKARVYSSTRKYIGPEKLWTAQLDCENQNALIIHIWGCRSLKAGTLGQQPSPYVVYRFYTHPDHSSNIIPCSNNPQFGDEAVYPVNLSTDLECYLQQQCLYVYVFDDEETQPASYLGKAEVPLHSLAQGNRIQGDFALINPHAKCAGSVQLSLEWKFPYHAPGRNLCNSVTNGHLIKKKVQEVQILQHSSHGKRLPRDAPHVHVSKYKSTKSRKAETDLQRDVHSSKRGRRDGHTTDVYEQEKRHHTAPSEYHIEETDMAVEDIEVEQEQQTEAMVDDDVCESDDDTALIQNGKNYFSESQSLTNDDDDDDDMIIVAKPLLPYTLPSSRIRVEIASLTLDPCSLVVADESVERVFVEFQFAGVPPEETETPLSLRKPIQGEEIYYHFSKVIHLGGKEHSDRRHFLCMLLEGSDSEGERVRLRFTVVSDPMNEEDEDCRDVGYAYLDLQHLLRRSVDPAEETLQVLDVSDPGQIIGSLRVVIEAREAARAVYKDKRMRTTRASPSIIIN